MRYKIMIFFMYRTNLDLLKLALISDIRIKSLKIQTFWLY